MLSIKESRISPPIAEGARSPSLNIASITDNSVLVVSSPVKAIQSFTHKPAPTRFEPLKIILRNYQHIELLGPLKLDKESLGTCREVVTCLGCLISSWVSLHKMER